MTGMVLPVCSILSLVRSNVLSITLFMGRSFLLFVTECEAAPRFRAKRGAVSSGGFASGRRVA